MGDGCRVTTAEQVTDDAAAGLCDEQQGSRYVDQLAPRTVERGPLRGERGGKGVCERPDAVPVVKSGGAGLDRLTCRTNRS